MFKGREIICKYMQRTRKKSDQWRAMAEIVAAKNAILSTYICREIKYNRIY